MPIVRLVPIAAVSVPLTPAFEVPDALLPLPDAGLPDAGGVVTPLTEVSVIVLAVLSVDDASFVVPWLLHAAKNKMAAIAIEFA